MHTFYAAHPATKFTRYLLLLLLAIGCASSRATNTPTVEIWVVTDRQHPVKVSPGIRLIELDAPARLEAELADKLPRDPQQAAAIARQRLKDGGPPLQRRFMIAYQGVIDASGIGITKIPAVVVDKRYVIYGEQDVDRAVSWIHQYRSTHP